MRMRPVLLRRERRAGAEAGFSPEFTAEHLTKAAPHAMDGPIHAHSLSPLGTVEIPATRHAHTAYVRRRGAAVLVSTLRLRNP
jgi:hypothetical protein